MGVIATLLPTAGHLHRLRTAIRDRHQGVPCEDWAALLRVCERQVVREALAGVDATTRDAVLLAVTRAHQRLSPEGLARLLALPRRTVSQRLANAGFPAPQRLLSWGRLIVAAHLLEDHHRSADRIA